MKYFVARAIIVIACITYFFSSTATAQQGGYVGSLSVTKGNTLRFYISTSVKTFDLAIYRLGADKEQVHTLASVSGGIQSVPDSAFTYGCHWKPSAELLIPTSWKSGIYEADFPTDSGMKRLVFVVKEPVLGSVSKTVVCLTVNTWQAYNSWGGKSLYNFNSSNMLYVPFVSFDRPFSDTTAEQYYMWADKLVQWLAREHIDAEFCINSDLDADPTFLDHYNVYCTVGHDEYWSRPERNQIQWLVNRGGKFIILSGNTCWWQVRFDSTQRTMTCYKDAGLDPLHNYQDSVVTDLWTSYTVAAPENTLTGTSFANGGYVCNDTVLPQSKGYGGYTVHHSSSWVFNGTGLHNGDVFGQSSPIVGYETDGALYQFNLDSELVLIRVDQTPSNFTILGTSPAGASSGGISGAATMGCYSNPNGGAVFNAASIYWSYGLLGDSVVSRITKNVFDRFTDTKKIFPPQVITYTPRTSTTDTINHQRVYLLHRAVYCPPNINDTFAVHALDPQGLPLHYTWKRGYFFVGHDSTIAINFGQNSCFNDPQFLSVTVSNDFDSTTIGWWVIDSTIAFVTEPPFFPYYKHSVFSYSPTAISMFDEHPRYALANAPSWLTMDSTGFVYGRLDSGNNVNFSVIASDKKGHSARQNITISIKDTLASVISKSDQLQSVTLSSNPFVTQTTFSISLSEPSHISIEIASPTGVLIRSLSSAGNFYNDAAKIEWDGTDANGASVSSGVYFCLITITPPNGASQYILKNLIKL